MPAELDREEARSRTGNHAISIPGRTCNTAESTPLRGAIHLWNDTGRLKRSLTPSEFG
jgi:hypothetical protein